MHGQIKSNFRYFWAGPLGELASLKVAVFHKVPESEFRPNAPPALNLSAITSADRVYAATQRCQLNGMEQQPLLPEELLNIDGIIKISTFLTYAPRFKEDIFLVMDRQSPADVPPSFLPASIATFLARLCDLSDGC